MQLQGLGNTDIIQGVNTVNQQEGTNISVLKRGKKLDRTIINLVLNLKGGAIINPRDK